MACKPTAYVTSIILLCNKVRSLQSHKIYAVLCKIYKVKVMQNCCPRNNVVTVVVVTVGMVKINKQCESNLLFYRIVQRNYDLFMFYYTSHLGLM